MKLNNMTDNKFKSTTLSTPKPTKAFKNYDKPTHRDINSAGFFPQKIPSSSSLKYELRKCAFLTLHCYYRTASYSRMNFS